MATESVMNAYELANFIDLERFKSYQCANFENVLAIGSDQNLILANLPAPDSTEDSFNDATRDAPSITYDVPRLVEFQDTSSRISVVTWINEELIGVGFESGLLICYNVRDNIKELFQFRAGNSSLQSIRTFEERGVKRIWLLYEEGLLLMVRMMFKYFFRLSNSLFIFR
jgi:hypothetical protein